jgi:prepilin-type processing-associated H-X9-DG protein
LEICNVENIPGHGGRGYVFEETPVMVLFVDGHVKGPYEYDNEFDTTTEGRHSGRPVYYYPNTTPPWWD